MDLSIRDRSRGGASIEALMLLGSLRILGLWVTVTEEERCRIVLRAIRAPPKSKRNSREDLKPKMAHKALISKIPKNMAKI